MSDREGLLDELEKSVTNLGLAPVEVLDGHGYICIALSGHLGEIMKHLDKPLLKRVEGFHQPVIAFSLVNIQKLSDNDLTQHGKSFVQMIEDIAPKGKRRVFVKCPDPLKIFLTKNLATKSDFVENLAILKTQAAIGKTDEFVQETSTIIDATQAIFKNQFGIDVKRKISAHPKASAGGLKIEGEVIGTIDISSNRLAGQIVFSMPNKTVSKLCEKALGAPLNPTDPDFAQIVGEICNLVLGHTKEKLNKEGYGIIQAVPTCISTANAKGKSSLFINNRCWLVNFGSPLGDFDLYISLVDPSK